MKDIHDYLKWRVAVENVPEGRITPAKLLLEHGQEFPVGPNTYRIRKGKPKQCYMNAGKAVLNNPFLTYVEGFIIYEGIPLEHAWAIDPDGFVVEPTIRRDGLPYTYYGIPFDRDYFREATYNSGVWGLISHTNRDLFDPLKTPVDKFKAKAVK